MKYKTYRKDTIESDDDDDLLYDEEEEKKGNEEFNEDLNWIEDEI